MSQNVVRGFRLLDAMECTMGVRRQEVLDLIVDGESPQDSDSSAQVRMPRPHPRMLDHSSLLMTLFYVKNSIAALEHQFLADQSRTTKAVPGILRDAHDLSATEFLRSHLCSLDMQI